ncbi:MAG: pyridoxal-dependent decarboxylase, partial [Henriciella sp.]
MVDTAVDKMERASEGRVWTPVPDALKRDLSETFPGAGSAPDGLDEALARLLPYGFGNTHPRFFGWVHGGGTPAGLVPEIIAAAMNSNAGGRDHAAIYVERQLISWVRELFGFPVSASGLTVSGTSMATLVALKAARDAATNFAARTGGVSETKLVGYTSSEGHSCLARAFDLLGLGSNALREISVDDEFTIDVGALQETIEKDSANGYVPFVVIGTAGTVNTGAIDDLAALRQVASESQLWLHVDGAFGAAGILSDELRPKLSGIETADSLAFDFHKWLHVNYDAGFVLVRDG